MPRSAPEAFTADTPAAIAALSSGLGTWLGKRPSGSRNWLPARGTDGHRLIFVLRPSTPVFVVSCRSLMICGPGVPVYQISGLTWGDTKFVKNPRQPDSVDGSGSELHQRCRHPGAPGHRWRGSHRCHCPRPGPHGSLHRITTSCHT